MPSLKPLSVADAITGGHHFELGTAKVVPDSHSWTSLDVHPSVTDPTSPALSLPVINMIDPEAARQVAHAFESWGAFLLTGHGTPSGVLDGLEEQARRLFTLSAREKLKAARSPGSISGYGLVPISTFFSKLMWSEGFTVSGSPKAHAFALWPDNPNPFCEALEDYIEEMRVMGRRVAALVLRALGLEEEDGDGSTAAMEGVLQLNWYPACPDPARAIGMAAHTDSGLITILHQTTGTSGLQVLRVGKDHPAQWIPVPPVVGALIVIAGDLLHIYSDGRFRSAVHRVTVNRTVARFSAAYFCGPPAGTAVGPDPRLVDLERGPRFRAVTWAEYRGIKGKRVQGAIDEIRQQPSTAVSDDDILGNKLSEDFVSKTSV